MTTHLEIDPLAILLGFFGGYAIGRGGYDALYEKNYRLAALVAIVLASLFFGWSEQSRAIFAHLLAYGLFYPAFLIAGFLYGARPALQRRDPASAAAAAFFELMRGVFKNLIRLFQRASGVERSGAPTQNHSGARGLSGTTLEGAQRERARMMQEEFKRRHPKSGANANNGSSKNSGGKT